MSSAVKLIMQWLSVQAVWDGISRSAALDPRSTSRVTADSAVLGHSAKAASWLCQGRTARPDIDTTWCWHEDKRPAYGITKTYVLSHAYTCLSIYLFSAHCALGCVSHKSSSLMTAVLVWKLFMGDWTDLTKTAIKLYCGFCISSVYAMKYQRHFLDAQAYFQNRMNID